MHVPGLGTGLLCLLLVPVLAVAYEVSLNLSSPSPPDNDSCTTEWETRHGQNWRGSRTYAVTHSSEDCKGTCLGTNGCLAVDVVHKFRSLYVCWLHFTTSKYHSSHGVTHYRLLHKCQPDINASRPHEAIGPSSVEEDCSPWFVRNNTHLSNGLHMRDIHTKDGCLNYCLEQPECFAVDIDYQSDTHIDWSVDCWVHTEEFDLVLPGYAEDVFLYQLTANCDSAAIVLSEDDYVDDESFTSAPTTFHHGKLFQLIGGSSLPDKPVLMKVSPRPSLIEEPVRIISLSQKLSDSEVAGSATGNREAGWAGATGATGATGNTGRPGFDGYPGATGRPGVSGSTGLQGPQGQTGPYGRPGLAGPEGKTGVKGPPGPMGPPGPPSAGCEVEWTVDEKIHSFGGEPIVAFGPYSLPRCKLSCLFHPSCFAVDWDRLSKACYLHLDPKNLLVKHPNVDIDQYTLDRCYNKVAVTPQALRSSDNSFGDAASPAIISAITSVISTCLVIGAALLIFAWWRCRQLRRQEVALKASTSINEATYSEATHSTPGRSSTYGKTLLSP